MQLVVRFADHPIHPSPHLFIFGTETLICQISALGWLVGGGMGEVNCEANHEPLMFSLYFR